VRHQNVGRFTSRTRWEQGAQTTQGQQLLDLKKSYDAGAMSKQEYERLRKKIVEGR